MENDFPAGIYLLIFIVGAVTSGLCAPFWIRLTRNWHLVDHPGHRKIHRDPIPLAGGLIVSTGLVIPILAAIIAIRCSFPLLDAQIIDLSSYGLSTRSWQLAGLVIGALGMLMVGLIDDRHALPPGQKLLAQALVALLVALTGTRITLFIPSAFISYVITILWFLTLVNAFNFTDNMNGLCTGLGMISALILALHSALPGHYLVSSLGFLVAGALFGFIPSNFPHARAFLGDAGSHLVGYLIAALAVLPHFHHEAQPNRLGVFAPLLILGFVALDLCWVVVFRIRRGKPIYVGDTNHLSHQLVRRGYSTTRAVIVIWIGHALIASLSFCLI